MRRPRKSQPFVKTSQRSILLLVDFVVRPSGAGFATQEMMEDNAPAEAMYWGYDKESGRVLLILPTAKQKFARYSLAAHQPSSPSWKNDPSYNWVKETARAKANGW